MDINFKNYQNRAITFKREQIKEILQKLKKYGYSSFNITNTVYAINKCCLEENTDPAIILWDNSNWDWETKKYFQINNYEIIDYNSLIKTKIKLDDLNIFKV